MNSNMENINIKRDTYIRKTSKENSLIFTFISKLKQLFFFPPLNVAQIMSNSPIFFIKVLSRRNCLLLELKASKGWFTN